MGGDMSRPVSTSSHAKMMARIQAERRAIQHRLAPLGSESMGGRRSSFAGGDNTPISELMEAAQEAMATDISLASRAVLLARLKALAQVEERIRQGTYGVCEGCGERIPSGRLEAVPEATRCVACAERESVTA
jgi:RNA polymerase-binding transcription factor DksA